MAASRRASSPGDDLDIELSFSGMDINDDTGGPSESGRMTRVCDMALTGNVTSPELELLDPTPDLPLLFRLFDLRWFRGILSDKKVTIKWSENMKRKSGSTRCNMYRCGITLSKPLLILRPRKNLIETLIHEMIHAYLFLIGEDDNDLHHGPEFLKLMNQINREAGCSISVYHEFHREVESLQKHVWLCSRCGDVVRRLLNRGPSRTELWFRRHEVECGGSYEKVPPDDERVAVPVQEKADKEES